MLRLYKRVILGIEAAFPDIADAVPAPKPEKRDGILVFRYSEQSVQQALVLKAARLSSALGASFVLLENGYIQDLRAQFRILDEFQEDIVFLGEAVSSGTLSALQERYLKDFWAEEFDVEGDPLKSSQKRDRISRDKIQAAIARQSIYPANPSDGQAVQRTLSKTYSGYIHGAAPHILELYGGQPGKFHLRGMTGTPVMPVVLNEASAYYYRGLLAILFVAFLLKCEKAEPELRMLKQQYEELTGIGQGDAEEMIKELKK